MDLFPAYYLERLNCRTIADDFGFMVYQIMDKEFFIREYYITPEKRKTNIHSFYFDKAIEIAKSSGCEYFSCSVNIKANGAKHALVFILKQNFKILTCENNIIVLTRELENGRIKTTKET